MKQAFLLFVTLLGILGCGSGLPPDRPGTSVAGIVGDPGATDTACTDARWATGMCDLIVAVEATTPDPYYLPLEIVQWGVGTLSTESPPTIWERGTVFDPSTNQVAVRTARVWLYDVHQIWNRLCGSTSGTCGFHAVYRVSSNASSYPHRLVLYYGRAGVNAPVRFQALQFTGSDAQDVVAPAVFAVAYDTTTGSYGTSQAARRMSYNTGASNATAPSAYTTTPAGTYDGHVALNATGTLFADDGLLHHWGPTFLWTADD